MYKYGNFWETYLILMKKTSIKISFSYSPKINNDIDPSSIGGIGIRFYIT